LQQDEALDFKSAVFVGARLFDRLELTQGGIPSSLVIFQDMLAAVGGYSHQAHRFLAQLIATEADIVAIAERLPLGDNGAARQSKT